ncbi:unnamed protein product [Lymnaea stagnalis]|uniref:Angiotensin-converting enzyme n=1 Tax=Lymnaea stagnalis TaxID=6523 RepID=A0AAV2IFZ3_LYMST
MKILGHLLLLTVTSLCQDLDFDFNFDDFVEDNIELIPGYTLRSSDAIYSNQLYASDFLRELNNELRQWKHTTSLADWEYKTNITDANMKHKLDLGSRFDKWWRRRLKEAKKFDVSRLPDHLSRQLSMMTMASTSEDNTLTERKNFLISRMEGIYGSAQACLGNGSCVPLEPDLVNIMATSRDPEALKDAWVSWRDGVGPQIRDYYEEFIQTSNDEALENGHADFSHMWKQDLFYQTPELDSMLRHLWRDLKPLYLQLHAYVRRKLRVHYGSDVVGHDGTIPAHLLGNMWAQHWTSILDVVVPYPEDDQQTKVEAKLKANLDVQGLFRLADNFYTSIGLYPMTPTFWAKSMFKKPTGREVLCHASAFDMYYPGDFRIKMCAEVNLESFRTVHHEMGHVEYYMAYADQPTVFREGANPAFHEAVGDTVQLSVLSHSHLKGLGFVDEDEEDDLLREGSHTTRYRYRRTDKKEKTKINFLLNMALEKLAFIPFGLLVDMWRWDVMKGKITPDDYNQKWWEMR